MKFWTLLVILFLNLNSVSMGSQFLLGPALGYRSYSTTSGGVTSESQTIFSDLRIGSSLSNAFVFGGVYSSFKKSSGTTEEEHFGMGPSVGYLGDSWMTYITYYTSSRFSSGNTVLKGGGYQVDLAYHFSMAQFLIGPMLSYKKFEYRTSEVGGVESSIEIVETFTDPYLSVIFFF